MRSICILLGVCFQISAFAQPGSEIILFDVSVNANNIVLSNPVNITKHKGYDSQPFFYKNDIYYSSAGDSAQTDIKKYNYKTKVTSVLTNTKENEFSPTITPDQKFISCILQRKNGNQDLVKYPIQGGGAITIVDNLKVGYHTWSGDNILLLFVLEDTNTNALHYYNTLTKEDRKITTNIGRSLHRIPGKNAISFVQKTAKEWLIKEYDLSSKKTSIIIPTLPDNEDITWTKSGIIISSDGKDIYFSKPGNRNWQKAKISGEISLKNITRLGLNKQNTKLAVVVAE